MKGNASTEVGDRGRQMQTCKVGGSRKMGGWRERVERTEGREGEGERKEIEEIGEEKVRVRDR